VSRVVVKTSAKRQSEILATIHKSPGIGTTMLAMRLELSTSRIRQLCVGLIERGLIRIDRSKAGTKAFQCKYYIN
jgi:DNA-binding IclR family transcriptional regulator